MSQYHLRKTLITAALAAGLVPAGQALAAMTIVPTADGSYLSIGYGATGSIGQISPLLFARDSIGSVLGGGALPPSDQVNGTALEFASNAVGSLGGAVQTLIYAFRNTGPANFTDLRFMLNVQPDGSNSFLDNVSESWGPAVSGDPDRRQVTDFGTTPSLNDMQANNGVSTDGRKDCAGACDADFGLQWNLASLAPSQTWTVTVHLVDDPSLVKGGRYLQATSADTANTSLIVGNVQLVPEPGTWAMMAAGIALLPLLRKRRTG